MLLWFGKLFSLEIVVFYIYWCVGEGDPELDSTWITRVELQHLDPDLLEYNQSCYEPHSKGLSYSHPGRVDVDTKLMLIDSGPDYKI